MLIASEPYIDRFARFGLEVLLPLCRDRFADPIHGGFYEKLDAIGRPLPIGTKRLMVQCRQLYVLSHAALLGDSSGEAAARVGYRFLRRSYYDADRGGWFFQSSDAGEPVDRHKDLYAHAFVLFMLAYGHRAFQFPDAMSLASETMDILHDRLAASGGGFWDGASEDWQPYRAVRRQNPHMHLLEAVLALFEATGDRRWLSEAEALVRLFRERFFDWRSGMLGEFFSSDWSLDPITGHIIEPGHHFEWVWLLHRYATLSGQPVDSAAGTLFDTAMRYGVEVECGGVLDQHDRSGRPVSRNRRIWAAAEGIKAQIVRSQARLRFPVDQPGALIRYVYEKHLQPARVGWIETIARDGNQGSTSLPGSTPYHLFLAAAEVARLLTTLL